MAAGTLVFTNAAIEWLERAGLVQTYDTVDGVQILAEPAWERHGDLWRTSRYGLRSMADQSFRDKQHRGSDSVVFVLGGSWAMGFPFADGGDRALEGSFPYFLEQGLRGSRGAPVQVIGGGGSGHDSNKVVALAEEALHHDPAALFIASCNNEGLNTPPQNPLHSWLLGQAGYRLLIQVLGADPGITAIMSQPATLNEGGAQFEENLRAIVFAGEQAGVPVLLATLPLNLTHKYLTRPASQGGDHQEWPKTTFLEDLDETEPALLENISSCSAAMYLFEAPRADKRGLAAFADCISHLRETGREHLARDFLVTAASYYLALPGRLRADEARNVLRGAVGTCAMEGIELYLSGANPEAIQQLSKCDSDSPVLPWSGLAALGEGNTETARRLLLQSAEEVPNGRCRPSYNRVIRKITADSPNAHLVDLEQAAATLSFPAPPTPLFLDNCHMTWQGYRLMADKAQEVLAPLMSYSVASNPTAEAWAPLYDVPMDLHQQIGYAHQRGMVQERQ